ncbi:MAG: 2'-5' RNA ligase [Rhodanobacter sp.]
MGYLYRMQRLMSVIVAEIKTITVPPTQSELAAGINYFFGLLPDNDARFAITAVGERFSKSHRVIGSPVGAEGLHLSLCPTGKPEGLRQPIETALLKAGGAVRSSGFNVILDSAMRFSARDGQFPFVLCADGRTIELALRLRKAIAAEQVRVGLQVTGVSSYLPHVVLLEGRGIEAISESIPLIEWKVEDFVLIRSFFGQSRHEVIGRWPLVIKSEPKVYDMLDELANMGDLPDIDDELI